MVDSFARPIDYVRISLTDRCQLRCKYCLPAAGISCLKPHEQLSKNEIKQVARILANLGIKKIKLTGGEPLLYPEIASLIGDLKAIANIEAVTLTTNGILLASVIQDLVNAGLDGVNISLDTVNCERFHQITRHNQLEAVLAGIDATLKSPLKQVKINSVLTDFLTETDVFELVNLTMHQNIQLRFIEWMPLGKSKPVKALSETKIKALLADRFGPVTPFTKKLGNGPARYYEIAGFTGKIGFISALTQHFCQTCNRVRITPDGFFKTCLAFDHGLDLKRALQGNDLEEKILTALAMKPKQHLFGQAFANQERKNMVQIGG